MITMGADKFTLVMVQRPEKVAAELDAVGFTTFRGQPESLRAKHPKLAHFMAQNLLLTMRITGPYHHPERERPKATKKTAIMNNLQTTAMTGLLVDSDLLDL